MIVALWVCVVFLILASAAQSMSILYQHRINQRHAGTWQALYDLNNALRSRDDMLSGRLDDQHERIADLEEGMERLGPIIGHKKRGAEHE